jgi:hypothetical protein
MIDEPGSFSGKLNSPRPQRGPEPSQRMSLAIFQGAGEGLERAAGEHHAVVGGEGGELVRGGDERQPGHRRDHFRHGFAEALGGVEPGADGRAADS